MAARVRRPRFNDDKDLPPTYRTYSEREAKLRVELGQMNSAWGRQFFGYRGGTVDKVAAKETLRLMQEAAREIDMIRGWRQGFSILGKKNREGK
jgi:hypothetical protein